jgi:hypothetical protein
MWEPQPLATLSAYTACTGITLLYLTVKHRFPTRALCSGNRINQKVLIVATQLWPEIYIEGEDSASHI